LNVKTSVAKNNVAKNNVAQWGGGTAVLSGLIWTGFHIWLIQSGQLDDPMSLMSSLGILILPLLGFIFTSYALSQRNGRGRGGLLVMMGGMGLMLLGVIGASILQMGAAWLVGILGELITSIGLGWFALVSLSNKQLPVLNGLPLVMLLLYVPSWMVDPGNLPSLFPDHFTEWLAAVYGLCWVLLGGLLLANKMEVKGANGHTIGQ
jgi:hypothetical protein